MSQSSEQQLNDLRSRVEHLENTNKSENDDPDFLKLENARNLHVISQLKTKVSKLAITSGVIAFMAIAGFHPITMLIPAMYLCYIMWVTE